MEEKQMFSMSELNPLCLWRRLWKNWLLILAAGLIALMGTEIAVQNLYAPEYTAGAVLAVSVKRSSYSTVLSNLSMSAEIADTFTQLFESNMFGSVAAGQLGVESLPGTLKATVLPETNLLSLRVTADSPEDAFQTLKLMLENYDTVSEHVFQNVILKELDSPTVPTAPSNPVDISRVRRQAFLVGTAAMTALLLAAALCSDTVQTTAALRRKLDVKLFSTLHHEVKNRPCGQSCAGPTRGCSSPCRWPASTSPSRCISWE